MRNNFIKYIFAIFVIAIMIFAFYKIKKDETNKNQNQIKVQNSVIEEQKTAEINLGIAQFDNINPILSKNKNVQDQYAEK